MRRLVGFVGLCAALGCQQLIGIEEGMPSVAAGGAAAGGSASGGSASGGGGVGGTTSGGGDGGGGTGGSGGAGALPARDWSSDMLAVYRFENSSEDSSLNGRDLTASDDVEYVANAAQQGSFRVALMADSTMTNATAFLDVETGFGFIFGGWFRTDDARDQVLIERRDDNAGSRGFSLSIVAGEAVCSTGDGSSLHTIEGAWPADGWAHVMCVIDTNSSALSLWIDGTVADSKTGTNLHHSTVGDLRVGVGYAGGMDEVFLYSGELPDPAWLTRIYLCNVDGSACSCDPDEPAEWRSCPRAENNSMPCPPMACDAPWIGGA